MKPCRYECDECPECGICFCFHIVDGATIYTVDPMWVPRLTARGKLEPSSYYRSECEAEAEEEQEYGYDSLIWEREWSG